jgi:hypothetical protein
VIIISFVLLLVAMTLSFTGFFTRFDILDSENKKRSDALADACLDSARLEIALDNTFNGEKIVEVDGEKCRYKVESGGIVKIHACVNNAETFYEVLVNINNLDIPLNSFKEKDFINDLSTCPN